MHNMQFEEIPDYQKLYEILDTNKVGMIPKHEAAKGAELKGTLLKLLFGGVFLALLITLLFTFQISNEVSSIISTTTTINTTPSVITPITPITPINHHKESYMNQAYILISNTYSYRNSTTFNELSNSSHIKYQVFSIFRVDDTMWH